MRRSLMITAAAAALVVCGVPAASASGAWGTAKEVPGTAALNKGGGAQVTSVSCATAGNCGAGGYYTALINSHIATRPFVDNQTNGTWGKAREVPGMSALHPSQYASVASVSCASTGNCGAGGYYTIGPSANNREAFVVSETGGTWDTAEEVTGFPVNSAASIVSVSCRGAGNCSAGGYYYAYGGGNVQAFVVNETGGVWGAAEEVPGTATLNTGANAELTSVSCASAGNCSAGGYYTDGSGGQQAFVVNETGGTWGTAEEVPGTAALNTVGRAKLASVSCASAGNCSAGGDYTTSSGLEVFVVSETSGTWGTAEEVPGTAELNQGGAAQISSVSCASAGNCSAGGYYTAARWYRAFVVSEAGGTWGTAEEVPGLTAINPTGSSFLTSVSCGAAGNCSAGGLYDIDGTANTQAFVVSETSGTWGSAQDVAGTGQQSAIGSVSCSTASRCVAGGGNPDSSGKLQAFVVPRT
jgi:hypothetical protein